MSEIHKAHMVPSTREYKGDKINLSNEAVKKIIDEVKDMNAMQVAEKLGKYKNTIPGKNKDDNTFEMMALYQRALTLLWTATSLDARFGAQTYSNLKIVQASKLGLKWKEADGFPGPNSTNAIIRILWEQATTKQPVPKTHEEKKPAVSISVVQKPESKGATVLPEAKLDIIKEQVRVKEIIANAQKPSMIILSWNGSFYNGSSPKIIDYAVVKQDDGEFFIFDKPTPEWARMVYRTQANYNIISMSKITNAGLVTLINGAPMKGLQYQPTPSK
jgi:hypothetical protein